MQLAPKFGLRQPQLEQILVPVSLLYLAIPYAIFCIGWLHWYWAVLVIALSTAAVIEATLLAKRHAFTPTSVRDSTLELTRRNLIFVLCLALAWVTLSGVGGIGLQR